MRSDIQMQENDIHEDINMLREVRQFLDQLEAPFGFLKKEVKDLEKSVVKKEDSMLAEEKKGDHRYFQKEKAIEAKFDRISQSLASKAGVTEIPWAQATMVVLAVYLILTIFSLFYRADFLSLTICTIGIYIIDNPRDIERQTFRYLVAGIAVTWLYDILFFMLRSPAQENKLSGHTEGTVIYFSFTCAWISFFWRIIVAIVFWKDSLDFRNIVQKQIGGITGSRTGSISLSVEEQDEATLKKITD